MQGKTASAAEKSSSSVYLKQERYMIRPLNWSKNKNLRSWITQSTDECSIVSPVRDVNENMSMHHLPAFRNDAFHPGSFGSSQPDMTVFNHDTSADVQHT